MWHPQAKGTQIIVALDFPSRELAEAFVDRINPSLCRLKVGKELFTRSGPQFVEKLVAKGFDVFLDLKFHDIPNTVAKACSAAAELGVWMINIHAQGGRRMMEFASNAIDKHSHKPLLIAVTVLTSLDESELHEIGLQGSPRDNVLRLAQLTKACGLDGVVCSPEEIPLLRENVGKDFCLVTPGIRPSGSAVDDQKRIMTPSKAIQLGTDYLVIGRPITQAENPLAILEEISLDIRQVSVE